MNLLSANYKVFTVLPTYLNENMIYEIEWTFYVVKVGNKCEKLSIERNKKAHY